MSNFFKKLYIVLNRDLQVACRLNRNVLGMEEREYDTTAIQIKIEFEYEILIGFVLASVIFLLYINLFDDYTSILISKNNVLESKCLKIRTDSSA